MEGVLDGAEPLALELARTMGPHALDELQGRVQVGRGGLRHLWPCAIDSDWFDRRQTWLREHSWLSDAISAARVLRSVTRSATRTSSPSGAGCRISCRCARWSTAGLDASASARAASKRARSRRSFKHSREGAARPLPSSTWWEAATPHPETNSVATSSSSWPSSSSSVSPPLVARFTASSIRPTSSSSSWPSSSPIASPPSVDRSVAHGFAA